mgnify:CR=1 FL=1
MKKLMIAALTAFSILSPTKLNTAEKQDTIKKGEITTLVNVATGETVRVRMSDPSAWNWVDPKLSERLDSAALETEKSKTGACTLYLPPIYGEETGVPRKIEIIFSPMVEELAKRLGYNGMWSWGKVGKRIITAYKQNSTYDINNDGVMGFCEVVGSSSLCFPYAVFMATLMRNIGFDPRIFEIQRGWFKESGEKDTIVIRLDTQFSGHAIVYLKPYIYDNEEAYPPRFGGDPRGFVPVEEYNIEGVCTPPSFDDPFMRDKGWFPTIFIFAAKNSPWEIEMVEITDTSHPLAFQLLECKKNHSMWVVGGMDVMYYHWGPVTIIDTTTRKEKWIMVYDDRLETVDVEITYSESTIEKNYAIVFSPEAREMVEQIVKGMSSSQK